MPAKYLRWQQTWKNRHPKWRYIFWSEPTMDELVKTSYPWYYPTWQSWKQLIQKVDVFKFIALNIFGGFYIDMDSECLRTLDELTEADHCEFGIGGFKNVFGKWAKLIGMQLCCNNSFIFSIPHHPFLLIFLEKTQEWQKTVTGNDRQLVVFSTGPVAVSKMVAKYRRQFDLCVIDEHKTELYPYERGRFPDAFIVHHSEATWASKDVFWHIFNPANGQDPENNIALTVAVIVLLLTLIIILASTVPFWYQKK
jgi:mannosyltransferase OCH1-like enzyme